MYISAVTVAEFLIVSDHHHVAAKARDKLRWTHFSSNYCRHRGHMRCSPPRWTGARASQARAVVRWVGPRKDVRTWTGAVVAKRECEVVDATLQPTTLAVWGYDKVVALGSMLHEVISYTGRASDWRGRSLNADKIERVRCDELKRRFFAPGLQAYLSTKSCEARDAYAVLPHYRAITV